jgi:hypothetical protein
MSIDNFAATDVHIGEETNPQKTQLINMTGEMCHLC